MRDCEHLFPKRFEACYSGLASYFVPRTLRFALRSSYFVLRTSYFVFLLVLPCFGQDSTRTHDVLSVAITTGVNSESLDWSIAGTVHGKDPNIYSELIWRKITGLQSGARISVHVINRFFLGIDLAKTFITSGRVTDSDYAEDDRTIRTFFVDLPSNEGCIVEASPTLSYSFFDQSRFRLLAFVGYQWSNQSLAIGKYKETSYQAIWKGPLAGGECLFKISPKIEVLASLQYQQSRYTGEGNWGLIEEFKHPVSYRQEAKGFSLNLNVGPGFHVHDRWTVFAEGGFVYGKTGYGVDTLYLKNGQSPQTRFNGVTRRGYRLNLGVNFNLR